MDITIYTQKANSLQGKEIDFSIYQGKTIIIVNTASKCGFTPQYEGLETLYKKYKEQGLVILGFPCNQFGNQEPGTSKEISEGCLINYGVSFPMFAKVDVNGKNTHLIYTYLKNSIPNIWGKSIKWNFTKFVIDKTGKPVKRFSPTTKPEAMEAYIQSLL